jgi:uncharacterized protein (TIGR02466 family)
MFNIFSSFLSIDTFKFNVEKYKKEILNIKKKNKGITRSSYGGWRSDNFTTVPKEFTDLFNKIDTNIKKLQKNLHFSKKLRLLNFWFNVNGLGSFNRPHIHNRSAISGVYYILIPENSGSIVFMNKDIDDFYTCIDKYNEYNSSNWTIHPEENKCILFPSYLKHYVEPNLNKKERISISFNYGF